MRKFLLALPLLLASCATPGTPADLNLLIAQIQAYTAQVCSYQPAAASVAQLIAAFYTNAAPAIGIVNTIGDAICRAPVTSATVRRGTTVVTRIVPTPKGPVVIKGYSAVRRGAAGDTRIVQTPVGPIVVYAR